MIKLIKKAIKNPKTAGLYLLEMPLFHFLPDKFYIKLQYYLRTGKILKLNSAQSFNEKLQWLKLYDRNPLYTKLVDKYEVRKYIAEIIGEEYLIPLLGVWDRFEDIDFDKLPNQFVLKCTHDSGGIVICKDFNRLDLEAARE
ncbi:MAG: glycosyl transferase, partial [Firmicutes bacterium HGW-Firmicutes-3]